MKEVIKSYQLNKNFNLFISKKRSILYLKSIYGVIAIKLASYYFIKTNKNLLSFIYLNKFLFISFIKHFINYYKRLHCLYTVRIKITGLGYGLKRVTNNFYYFSFNYTNKYYFHIPKNLLIKKYRKRIMLISNDFWLLKITFSHILLLKKMGVYRILGLRYPRQIILLKKGGKKK